VIDPILVDLYAGDELFAIDRLIATGAPWCGAMLKVSQGTYYAAPAWLDAMWPRARAAGDRYGVSWFRIPYIYLDVSQDGAAQAAFALKQIDAAGGLDHGDPLVVIDVERGGQHPNATKAQIVDVGSKCAAMLRTRTGREVVCYGGDYLRSNGVTIDELGCDLGWVADYNANLPATQYESIGCPLERLLAWQYGGKNGDGSEAVGLQGYPHTTPAGNADLSALVIPGGVSYLARLCASS
jgi:hypothetical protein